MERRILSQVVALLCWSHSILAISPSDNIHDYVANYGIHAESHTIVTEDGYILTAFRLPHPGAKVVMFQHGILSSAWCWIDNEPSLAPALQVYNMGYDVWLTNSRGNTFSRQHKELKPTLSKEFWNFSFADLGRKDVPANINYIISTTHQESLTLIGHSQGTSQVFVALTDPATKDLMKARVNLFVALSPITYMKHQTAKLFDVLTYFGVGTALTDMWPYGAFEWRSLSSMTHAVCVLTGGALCKLTVDTICGISTEDTDGAINNISAHFPAGTSMKSIEHYGQLIQSGGFKDYDYGADENMKVYGSKEPPSFVLGDAAKIPIAMFIGTHDDLGDVKDESRAASELPEESSVFTEFFNDFSHITWIGGNKKSFQAWFPKMQKLMKQYNPLGEDNQVLVV
mmetsp:Transcript_19030/g.34402  ORF Transcript_19030/g.34402 Transcript_19030/m.34402 type:complete len:399 (+) Transcript_19030:71-1267(+)